MLISDVSVRRPVFAAVISLILVIVGVISANSMTVREYPDIQRPVVSVETNYRGASADIVERRVTQLIENQIAGIAGIRKVSSSSADGQSEISIEFSRDRDIDSAANDVRERVARTLDNLPDEADPPEITKDRAGTNATMWIRVSSSTRSLMEVSDFAERYLVDALSIVDGVARVRGSGRRNPAMRVWIDPVKLAARGLTVGDIEDALRRENVQLPAGRIESFTREFTLRTDTGFNTVDDFRNLPLRETDDGYVIRLGEVADVEIAPENVRTFSRNEGVTGFSLAIVPQAQANLLAVNNGVRKRLEEIRPNLPDDIDVGINLDNSVFIRASMIEVGKALGFAIALVLIVIYVFIGTLRATIIPALTIPVSIISAFIVMAALGFSLNTLTLLGFVLAIGLVVDDAIVVLENIARRIEKGEPTLLAATLGSREIGFAVIATTLVLIAVILPVSFMPGNIGMVFGEFGISLAAAVAFSSLIALTLVPMLTTKLYADNRLHRSRLTHAVDRLFIKISNAYGNSLRKMIRRPVLVLGSAAAILGFALWIGSSLQQEYMPREDRGIAMMRVTAPEGSSLEYTLECLKQAEQIAMEDVRNGNAVTALGRSGGWGNSQVNTARVFVPLTEWSQREDSAADIVARWNAQLPDITACRAFAVAPGAWSLGQSSRPLALVLGGTSYDELKAWRDIVLLEAEGLDSVRNLSSDYEERKPKIDIQIDRDRAADLGVSLSNVGRTLESILGSRVVTTFIDRGEEYPVLLQGRDSQRRSPGDLENIYVRSERSGQLIPLSNLVRLVEIAGPDELKRFDRQRAITISGSLAPGSTLGDALEDLERIVREELPSGVTINYDGESRDFRSTGNSVYITFLLAMLVAYLVLAAQFESFRHPLVIMTTVPLAVSGAIFGLYVFDATINIYSQIGAVMLIGLAAKNGVLIVEFANQLRDRGEEFTEALIQAAQTRLRPVLMTSMCTAFGAIPLLLASGAGALSRQSIGAVVFFGVTFSVLLTLLVVPVAYALIARNTKSPEYVSSMIDKLMASRSA
ncbi:MAG: efflux RND transporter permease subunit [Pseudomonadota bacterium]